MEYIHDENGRTWELKINVSQIKRVKAATKTSEDPGGIDLLDIANKEMLSRVLGDPILFVDILYILCKDEADSENVTDEQFGEGFGGDRIYDAAESFMSEIINFTPNPRQRMALGDLWNKIKQTDERAADLVQTEIAAIDPEAEARKSFDQSTSSQGSSE